MGGRGDDVRGVLRWYQERCVIMGLFIYSFDLYTAQSHTSVGSGRFTEVQYSQS